MGWAQVDRWLVFQTTVFVIILACGLTTSISSGLGRQDFGGTCVLYGNVNCTVVNSTPVFIVFGGDVSTCIFVTAVNLLISVFFGLIMCGYHLFYLIRSRILIRVVYQMWLKVLLLSSVLAALVTLVSACTLSVGVTHWCNAVEDAANNKTVPLSSCGETQDMHYEFYGGNGGVPLESH